MEKKYTLITLLVILASALYSQDTSTISSLRKHVEFLASDDLQGRKAGSYGDSLAANYIRDQFVKCNAFLLGNHGFQYFGLVTEVNLGDNNTFTLNDDNYFTVEKDFIPLSFSTSVRLKAQVVFGGFGIIGNSGKLIWDDYSNIDVKEKWVMVLRGDPEPDNPVSEFIPIATDRAKALLAKDKGASGILLVSPASIEKDDVLEELAFDKAISDAGIPVINISRRLAAKILKSSINVIDSLEKSMLATGMSTCLATKSFVGAEVSVLRVKKVSRNVVALLEGSDPTLKNEYIVIGAHYDHLGTGGDGSGSRVPGDRVTHGGADDNASGVASLIELTKFFSHNSNRPARSIIFVSFGAEELGIIGARYFIDNPPVPISSIKMMINLDMIGRLNLENPSLNISGTGTFNTADSVLDKIAKDYPFSINKITDGYGPSDHSAFYTSGIPVLFLSTGAHSDYHTPFDTPDRLNYHGHLSITRFTAHIIEAIAGLKAPIIFAETGDRRSSTQYSRGLKVTLGIMPDVSGAETSGGMKVEGTRKDAPAAKAGMLKGDIITAINGLPVSNIYDYMNRLSKLKKGETVNVEILRKGSKEVLIIQL